MTIVELTIAMVIFTIATATMLQLVMSGQGLRRTAREEWLATSVAQNVLEQMRALPFETICVHYDADPYNDPGGPGTSPGATFTVGNLDPTSADTDGFVGEVVLPMVNAGSAVAPDWQLREDIGDPLLGIPRDLTGDAIVSSENHLSDYTVLPVLVRIRWRGAYGPRELRFFVSFTQMQS